MKRDSLAHLFLRINMPQKKLSPTSGCRYLHLINRMWIQNVKIKKMRREIFIKFFHGIQNLELRIFSGRNHQFCSSASHFNGEIHTAVPGINLAHTCQVKIWNGRLYIWNVP